MNKKVCLDQNVEDPTHVSEKSLTEYFRAFLEDITAGKNNETRTSYQSKVKRLFDFLGENAKLEDLTTEKLTDFRISLQTRKMHRQGYNLVRWSRVFRQQNG